MISSSGAVDVTWGLSSVCLVIVLFLRISALLISISSSSDFKESDYEADGEACTPMLCLCTLAHTKAQLSYLL